MRDHSQQCDDSRSHADSRTLCSATDEHLARRSSVSAHSEGQARVFSGEPFVAMGGIGMLSPYSRFERSNSCVRAAGAGYSGRRGYDAVAAAELAMYAECGSGSLCAREEKGAADVFD